MDFLLNAEKQKARSKAGFLNLAPLTGIAFASNWLISKLNLNCRSVKTTRMTTNRCGLHKSRLSVPEYIMIVTMILHNIMS